MRTRLLELCVLVGIVCASIGAALVFPPAGLIVFGAALVGFGLLVDDGAA